MVHNTAAANNAPSSPPVAGPQLGAAQAELTWLQRRFGSGLQLQTPAELDSAAAPSVAAGQCDASRRAQQQSVQDAQTGAVQLTVRLLPTDPAWDCGPLSICIRLAETYPAARSVEVLSVEPCQQCGDSRDSRADDGGAQAAHSSTQQLSAGVAQMLAKLLTAQAAANANRPAPLKALLRSLENNAAVFLQQVPASTIVLAHSCFGGPGSPCVSNGRRWHIAWTVLMQAEDMLLEVQRRRGAPASGTAPPADGGPGLDAKASSKNGLVGGADELESGASIRLIADDPQSDVPTSQDLPKAHPAALQPALFARRSFGQGLWWPGAAGAGGTDPGAAGAAGPSARLSRSSSAADDSSRSGDAATGSDTGSDTDGDSDSGSGSDSDSRSSGGEHGEAATGGTSHGGEGEARSAVALELVDLSVDNIDVIEPHNLRLQVGLTLGAACKCAESVAAYKTIHKVQGCVTCSVLPSIFMRDGAVCHVPRISMTSNFAHQQLAACM